MQRTERATERLKRCNDLGVLPISTALEIAERNHFDQVEQRDGFLPSRFI